MDVMRRYVKFGIDFDHDYIATLDALQTTDVQNFVRQYLDTGNRLTLVMTAQ